MLSGRLQTRISGSLSARRKVTWAVMGITGQFDLQEAGCLRRRLSGSHAPA